MARRTKEELEASGYYAWLKERERLLEKKKAGEKLTPVEKETVRVVPTPENPFKVSKEVSVDEIIPKAHRPADMKKITFDETEEFEVKGGYFLCKVKNAPYQDVECMVMCSRNDCPFFGKGYFHSKGVKF